MTHRTTRSVRRTLARTTLADTLVGDGFGVHRVGDCAHVGYIQGAVHSAAAVADSI